MGLNFLKENVTWIKDVFSIIFTGVATIIALLTYVRAKETLLQPVRTEVIKKQTEILTEILELLSKHGFSIDKKLDYVNLAQINTFRVLFDYGFIIKNQKEISEEIENHINGFIYCGESEVIDDVEVISMFPVAAASENEVEETRKKGLEKLEKAKSGQAVVDKIMVTKEHSKFIDKLSEYADNPFLPKTIQEVLNQIINDVHVNLTQYLRQALKNFIVKLCETRDEIPNPQFSPTGVYNEFNHMRINHRNEIERLKTEVREYLKIDKML